MLKLRLFIASLGLAICGFGAMQTSPVLAANPPSQPGSTNFDPSSTSANNIGGCDGTAASSSLCKDLKNDTNPLFGKDGITTKIAGIFALVTGIISVFMIIISGLRYIMSGGDATKTNSAKNGIIYSAIGIGVAVFAGTIAQFILTKISS